MTTFRRTSNLFPGLAAIAGISGAAAFLGQSGKNFTATEDLPEPTRHFNMKTRRYEKVDQNTPADLARKAKADAKRARKAAIRKR